MSKNNGTIMIGLEKFLRFGWIDSLILALSNYAIVKLVNSAISNNEMIRIIAKLSGTLKEFFFVSAIVIFSVWFIYVIYKLYKKYGSKNRQI